MLFKLFSRLSRKLIYSSYGKLRGLNQLFHRAAERFDLRDCGVNVGRDTQSLKLLVYDGDRENAVLVPELVAEGTGRLACDREHTDAAAHARVGAGGRGDSRD